MRPKIEVHHVKMAQDSDPQSNRGAGPAPSEWVTKGDADLLAAYLLLAAELPALASIVGFHAQQAVEKYLKAVLVAEGTDPPRDHNISRLLALVESVPIARHVRPITRFAVLDRYPALVASPSVDATQADAKEAVRYASGTRGAVCDRLDVDGDTLESGTTWVRIRDHLLPQLDFSSPSHDGASGLWSAYAEARSARLKVYAHTHRTVGTGATEREAVADMFTKLRRRGKS